MLDPLFARYEHIPRGFAQDLDADAQVGAAPRIPEINFAAVLAPGLRRTVVARGCTEIARQLHGPAAHLLFDHAIYKPPGKSAATPWHQDAIYAKHDEQVVALWVPLQAVGLTDGCMRFVPKSHLSGVSAHGRAASATNPRIFMANPGNSETAYGPVCEGGVVIHNAFTLHSTGPNDGMTTRRVWILNFGTGAGGDGHQTGSAQYASPGRDCHSASV